MDGMVIPAPPEGARDGVGASRARRLDLAITGMTCAACAARVERALSRGEGVLSASVNLATGQARVLLGTDLQEDDASVIARLQVAAAEAGYGASLLQEDTAGRDAAALEADHRERRQLILACLLSAPLLVSMLLHPLAVLLHQDRLAAQVMLPGWAQFVLATPVQFWLGWRFYRGAFAALQERSGNMDLLVVLGSTAAWGLSFVSLLRGSSTLYYFGISALIVTFVLLGRWLERDARRRAAESVRALASLRPDSAIRLDRNGAEREIPLAELRAGDLLVAHPNSRIAVDGVVREGSSGVDESFLAGESGLVTRSRGDRVTAGSLVLDGRLVIEALAVGTETRLAAIARLLETAQASRAPMQRLVDRVSAILVPVVLCLALFTFAGWWAASGHPSLALLHAVSVLVIACPCALGLATPLALVTGIGAAAKAGILIRDAAAIERARSVGIVAFDKAGTLTLGRPVLERAIPAGGGHYAEAAELLSLAAAMQAGNEHPLAEAVRSASGHAVTQVAERFAVLPGRGVSARVAGRSLLLGNRRMIEAEGLPLSGTLAGEADHIEAEGGTVSFLAERRPAKSGGNRVLGVLSFSDAVHPGANQAVQRLSRRGIMTVMLTGDGEGAARRVAEAVGVDRMLSGMMPQEKAGAVQALGRELRGGSAPRVAMVGEGINDVPALAASDLGIVMRGGADAAFEAAGIILMRSDPGLVADAIEIAALTAARIRQNLFWAFLYNLVGIALAMAGLLSPALAAGAMVLSSVSVAANALRLKNWRPAGDAGHEPASAPS